MSWILLLCMLVALITVIYITPWSIRYLKRIGVVVKDQNKANKPLVPISGGMSVLSGFFLGIMLFVFIDTFFPGQDGPLNGINLTRMLSALISIITITVVGFVDDLIIKENKETSSGLKQWQKPLLTLAAAIPLMVVNSGVSQIAIPFFGLTDVGLIYPLVLIPIGVVGAANMVNMLAGFNGAETGMGMVYVGMLAIYSFVNRDEVFAVERTSAMIIGAIMFAALLGFYLFNRYPAKILAGDSLTYLLGGTLASMAIIGNLERAALIASVPFFVEAVLKFRGKFDKKSYGYYENGKIKSYYRKIYSIPHLLTRTGKFNERQITYTLILMQLFFSSLMWVI